MNGYRQIGMGAAVPAPPSLSGPINWANVDFSLQGQLLAQLLPGVLPFGVPNIVLYAVVGLVLLKVLDK